MVDTQSFYNDFADYYHLLYADWEASVRRQAEDLDSVIKEHFGNRVTSVHDAACGIGTQAIGLASIGYRVSASDIATAELAKARANAADKGLVVDILESDMRRLDESLEAPVDIVIACDNSVPHLLNDEEILSAFKAFFRATVDHGGAIISVRDYAEMQLGGTQLHPRIIHDHEDGRLVMFDVWDFDGDRYSITVYVIHDYGEDGPSVTLARGGQYYCVTISKLEGLFLEAGFSDVSVLRSAYFQPLLVAKKGDAEA